MSNYFGLKTPYLWPLDKGGFIATDRIVAVGKYQSAPIYRAVKKAKLNNQLIDLTYGQTSYWALFMDSGHIVLCSDPMPVAIIDDPEFINFVIESKGEK
jgi:regulator of extracellular matrix RemA (YlzA/DUF370 family)